MSAHAYLPRELPEPLRGLTMLALDLRWNWYHGADRLWLSVDPTLWSASGNPWLILQTVSERRLQELAGDPRFLSELQNQLAQREAHFSADTWFSSLGTDLAGPIAYFSMEFGLSESLPIYSGGLGVLAGDFLKTACDLGVPLIGVGLLYQQGYFHQVIDARGEQIELHPYNDPTMLPVLPLRDQQGEWVHVELELPGRPLRLRSWRVQVGRRQLLLLDSNDPLNDPGDRGITAELYGGGTELRLQQEIALGIGGWRLLEQLGFSCPVCHVNEGHTAFALLERARGYMRSHDCDFRTALRATRAGNLFTSHTPVVSGFDRFPAALMARYFENYAARLGIALPDLLALGQFEPASAEQPFIPACLAVRASNALNGVSQLHGKVSRQLLAPLFPRWPLTDIPVGAITNGVHVPTWDSAAADTLWTDACGKARWRNDLTEVGAQLRCRDDASLWELRARNRRALVEFLDRRNARRTVAGDALYSTFDARHFDPDILTIGLARRFAGYKRPNLLLHDRERLLRLLTDRDRPVQLVVAGKAHPQDQDGKRLLHEWQTFLRHPQLRHRAIFIEDYDLGAAEHLLQGVDVWINTPRPPWEACGTSGMKILVNGGLNLSALDGWWAEAYRPELGWALGNAAATAEADDVDALHAQQLYQLLEEQVIPDFYQRDAQGLPRRWIARIRASMSALTPQYSSNRMLREYTERYYLPLAREYALRAERDVAVELEQWYEHLALHWSRLHFGHVISTTEEGYHQFEVQVYLEQIPPEAVSVQLYADGIDGGPSLCAELARIGALLGANNAFSYRGSVPAEHPISDFTVRIIPRHDRLNIPNEAPFILWHR